MKKVLEIALGIVTSIGGFLETGSIATAAQAGAEFRYQLGWSIVLGTLALIVLVEMSGRLSAVSGHTIVDAMRARFGGPLFLIPLLAVVLVSFLVLASEIAGVTVALHLATGISAQWWALPVTLAVWLLLWRGTFGMVENGVAILGLVTIAFLVAAFKLHPDWHAVAHGLLPTVPGQEKARYGFIAVSILGASISPYLYIFYSSGAIEDEWDTSYLAMNRVTSTVGMTFGGLLSFGVLICAAGVLAPQGVKIEQYEQIAQVLSTPLGHLGFWLFVASLGIACFGATSEIALATAYTMAQGFGWRWSENASPATNARFALTYTVVLVLAALPVLAGVDPLELTNVSMVLTAMSLPVTVVPMLVLMNDRDYVKNHGNSPASNILLLLVALLSVVLVFISVPLQCFGG